MKCEYKGHAYTVSFEVINQDVPNILGLQTCVDMNLVQRLDAIDNHDSDLLDSYSNVFKGLGCISDSDYHIKTDNSCSMSTIEDIVTIMPNAKVFSVLDTSSGFWQVKLDPSSAKLCTFNTPFRHYKFKRLPFGLSSSQDIFQRIMSDMFRDIDGCEVVIDDLLIWGETDEQHDKRLKQVLEEWESKISSLPRVNAN